MRQEFVHLGLPDHGRGHALCLSGGGIRSAAFCLGVLQALARYRLLPQFHYLSTVSGGGYIGGWLTRLIAQRFEAPPSGNPAAQRQDLENRLEALQRDIAAPRDGLETEAVSGLRRFTSYLTPNRGFATLDTWAGITLWLRNTLINWLVFLPVFAALAGLPILYVAAVYALATPDPSDLSSPAAHAGYLATFALLIAAVGTIICLPSHSHPDRDTSRPEDYGLSGSEVAARVVLPIVMWCLLAVASLATRPSDATDPSSATRAQDAEAVPSATMRRETSWDVSGRAVFARQPAPRPTCDPQPKTCSSLIVPDEEVPPASQPFTWSDLRDPMFRLPLLSLLTCVLAYVVALAWIAWKFRRPTETFERHMAPFKKGIVPWLAACLASSLFLLLGIWAQRGHDVMWLALAGPLWVALGEMLRTTIYVAMRNSGLRGDTDREWLARLNGSKLRFMTGLALGGLVIVVGSTQLATRSEAAWSWLVGGGAASGSIVAFLGRGAGTAFTPWSKAVPGQAKDTATGSRWTALLVDAAIILFGTTLFAAVGRGFGLLVGGMTSYLDHRTPDFGLLAAASAGLIVTSALLALLLGWMINLNRFSMHAVYRNRLIRAFLGSARVKKERRPDRFTQFDPRDNIRLADTFTGRPSGFLFPVINVALNRTSGRDTARAERKAESFTMTPFHCGAGSLPGPGGGGSAGDGAYAPTQGYACGESDTGPADKELGITLGTAMTISGAAASPNMGYHSSPLAAFVMTLFNVRLGAWLPNPAMPRSDAENVAEVLSKSGPTNEVPTLLKELIGRSDNTGDFLYLSDGGHFDNLGVYEMLRRRCKLIVAVDAGQDKTYAYEDLGRLKQNARIDLGVEIDFIGEIETRQKQLNPLGSFAKVAYPPSKDGKSYKGYLLYVKPWIPPGAPVELQSFQMKNSDFPHESTGNQFFTESDFESYRLLGNQITNTIIRDSLPDAQPEKAQSRRALGKMFRFIRRKIR